MSLSDRIKRLAGLPTEDRDGDGSKVLAVAAQKGGVGKTTTAVNLATALAGRPEVRRVLVIDLDGQGHVAAALSGVFDDMGSAAISDILLGKGRDVLEIARPTQVDKLYSTPSDKGLASTEGILAGRIGKEFLLRSAIKQARRRYDMIILDCPPNLGNLTLNALTAADACLIPCDMSFLSLAGVGDILGVIETVRERLDHDLQVLGILPTRVDHRNARVTDAVLAELQQAYGSLVTNTSIPFNSALPRAQMKGLPVSIFDPRSKGSIAYDQLAAEVLQRLDFTGFSGA